MEGKRAKDVIKAKRQEKKVSITQLAKTIGKNPTFVAAALQGNHRLTAEEAKQVGTALDLDQETVQSLSKFPVRADFPNTTDPFKYRLLEIIGVYGDALREMANEMFGDGIMSAIDFDMTMERQPDQKGDRVRIAMSGKFLSYKTY